MWLISLASRPATLIIALLAGQLAGAGGVEFHRQVVSLPTNGCSEHYWSFRDVDGDGRKDLLAFDPVAGAVSVNRQSGSGFPAVPQQEVALRKGSAWYALAVIEPGAAPAMVVGTASGLRFIRQNDGVFERQTRPLIEGSQVFTNSEFPVLVALRGATNATNVTLPLIAADRAVLHRRDAGGAWEPIETVPLQCRRGGLNVWPTKWCTAVQPAMELGLWRHCFAPTNDWRVKPPDEQAAREILKRIEKSSGSWHVADRVDINGRQDLAVWGCVGYVDTRTDVSIYLLGPDNRLSTQPNQVVRARGFPVQVGDNQRGSPFCDLDGDGHAELVLVRSKPTMLTSGGIADVILSGAMEWVLTVRTFKNGAFSTREEGRLEFTTMLPAEEGPGGFIRLGGDFNGDGRRDLLARRTPLQWQVYLSATNGSWFEPKPGFVFEIPEDGELSIADLNGDGCSDLVVQPWGQPRLVVFLSKGDGRPPRVP